MPMSAKARVKLCSGLAKIGWLSKRKFQAIFPKIKKITINNIKKDTTFDWLDEIEDYSYSILISGAINKKIDKFPVDISCNLKAGDILKIKTGGEWKEYLRASWSISFIVNKDRINAAGVCGGVGREIPGDISSIFIYKYNDFSESELLVPTGDGYYYTEELQKAFGLLRNNINVGTYPNCRRWAKD